MSSVGGGRTAAYINRIISRLDHLLSLGVVKGKFREAKGKVNRLGLARVERLFRPLVEDGLPNKCAQKAR